MQSSASNYSYNFFSAKYSSTGVSDNTYGTGGVSETDIIANRKSLDTSLDMAEGMALDNLGRVILVGSTVNATSEGQANWDEDAGDWTSDIAIVRHDTSGQEDIWFNFDGILTKSLPTPDAELIDTPVNDYGSDVVVQDDGKVITVGHFDTTDLHTDIIVTRMERDGRLDSTFGTDGELRFRLSDNNDYATAVALQDDGKILVTGYTVYGDVENDSVADTDIFVARFNSDGSVDTSFGDDLDGNGSKDGYKIIAFDRGGNDRDIANDILVQDDGKIVVAGSIEGSDDSINIDTDAVFIRLTADGQLDTDFRIPPTILSAMALDTISGMELMPTLMRLSMPLPSKVMDIFWLLAMGTLPDSVNPCSCALI